jgi:hypothetical protein
MSRAGEATGHHLFIANLDGYETEIDYAAYRERYEECGRMLNGLEKALERQLPDHERQWPNHGGEGRKTEP